ncbi:MAG TPA: Tm-1-like ATP-binding domain-containing protein, partial [Planctomycetaceae bacterium]|nr:Tm-1-like ATP-binding domain-containing protein [Planctomycetaceae bacterium]
MTILILGSFDTKADEHAFLRNLILARGHQVLTLNLGVLGTTNLFPVDIEADELARAGGVPLEELRANRDRGEAMKVMSRGAA